MSGVKLQYNGPTLKHIKIHTIGACVLVWKFKIRISGYQNSVGD